MGKRLGADFYRRDALIVAPALLGKILVSCPGEEPALRCRITETEAYCGESDAACHARAGKTARTAVMYRPGGLTYIYLCYGIHSLLNVVTGAAGEPQAVLIRAGEGLGGPGKLTKALRIGTRLNQADLTCSDRLWIEDDGARPAYRTDSRVGIGYAAEPYKSAPWRFIALESEQVRQKTHNTGKDDS